MTVVAPVPRPTVDIDLTETHWQPQGGMTFEEWEVCGQGLLRIGRAWHFWLGDFLLFGHKRFFGDRPATEVAAAAGLDLDHSTVSNVIRVSREIPPDRRRSDLTWSHHLQVAAMSEPEQERLLDLAEAEGMTAARLRARICKERLDAEAAVEAATAPVEATVVPGGSQAHTGAPVNRYTALVRVTAWAESRGLADHAHQKVRQRLETLGVEPVDADGEWEASGLPGRPPGRPATGTHTVVEFGPVRPAHASHGCRHPGRAGAASPAAAKRPWSCCSDTDGTPL